ncbi:MAG: DEAD/DEAH box helicase [Candidatus Micrarchaeota archaeon]|nr:DEAD/DEAH box helicase [Candidatus Micrarchaeota archaeon]
MTEFREMNLRPELAESLKRIGFVTATEVQEKAIPELMKGRNLVVRAKTGTGKTAAFLVPIMQRIGRTREMEAVILAPTRELAQQIAKFSRDVGGPLGISTVVVYGGASINAQMGALRHGVNILVGTPGRILDLMSRGALKTDMVRYLVLDEADVMLDMGFITDVERIIGRMPHNRQMMLFSATVPKEVVRIAEKYSEDSGRISAGPEEEPVVTTIKHEYAMVPRRLKFAGLLAYIKEHPPKKAIIFTRTKFEANAVNRVLGSQGYNTILMHGGLTQSARERSLGSFRNGAQFLIATNIASRGLDIADVTDIINFDAPDDPKVYIHRVGRSARMGKEGKAITIADTEQRVALQDIEHTAHIRMTRINLNTAPFENIDLPIRERHSSGHGRFGGRGGGRRFRGRGVRHEFS